MLLLLCTGNSNSREIQNSDVALVGGDFTETFGANVVLLRRLHTDPLQVLRPINIYVCFPLAKRTNCPFVVRRLLCHHTTDPREESWRSVEDEYTR